MNTVESLFAKMRPASICDTPIIKSAGNDSTRPSKAEIRARLSEDALFGITYVPFVIAEVVWDYVDTIFNQLRYLKVQETKRLCRAVKALHDEYDRRRYRLITDKWRSSELDNMEMFQRELAYFFNGAHSEYNKSIRESHPDLTDDYVWLLSSIYVCDTVLKALFRYAAAQEKVLSAVVGYKVRQILPQEIYTLSSLVSEFAGDKPMTAAVKDKESQYAESLAKIISEIGFIDIDEK